MIFGLSMLGIGTCVLTWAMYQSRRAKSQFTWDREPATVTNATLELGKGFYANIEYEYFHKGRRIRSNQLHTLEVSLPWPSSAQRTIDKYPVGSVISVYVDPNDPSNAVIEPGGDPKHLPLFITIAAFVFLAGLKQILAVP